MKIPERRLFLPILLLCPALLQPAGKPQRWREIREAFFSPEGAKKARSSQSSQPAKPSGSTPSTLRSQPKSKATQGQRRTAVGTIKSVSCAATSLTLTLKVRNHREIILHAANYFKTTFLTVHWTPPDPFNPCRDIKGMWARIVYTPVQGESFAGEIVSIDIEE